MAGARARGANAVSALAFEAEYGLPHNGNYRRMPFNSANLGEEQPLEPSEILGFGREPQQPSRGAVDNVGDMAVAMDVRNLGVWLKLFFGAPTTTTGLAATGSITFAAVPAANATISVGGQTFTFVSGTPTANQIKIGATVRETVANAVRVLNASAVAGVAAASYRTSAKGDAILITHDTLGTSGNSFALAASTDPVSGATVSGSTLSGGAATGAKHHTYVSGVATLPSASIEIGHPEVPDYTMNWGVKGNTLGIAMQRTGALNATLGLIAQGETPATESAAGTPEELEITRFSQFSGYVLRDGVPIADLTSGQFNYSNNLDPVPAIREDGRISGADEGVPSIGLTLGVRYSNRDLQVIAENGEPIELELGWSVPGTPWRFRILIHRFYLPKGKRPITGPGGVQVDYSGMAAEHPTLQRSLTLILTNDVNSYDNPS